MQVSSISNMDTTVTNQGHNKRTVEIAGVTTELKFLELDHPVEITISDEAKEQYEKKDIHTILSEIGLFERLK